ncbi:FKBP-type peptidyl-prolyl cis-trans isomerase [Advenella alkanexedens]|uniref:Peptidyl-prolyl cis-trans isomerase n=1 Tax=Advenella alkanexedens TaxID=1481665 RepID=A0ABS6NRM5_9BURK|nr:MULTISPECIES: FKBP-type peptidyl-prolyl cis-trans isomerase [Advenella]MBV4398029.1 FKBP-type peptidyl-prolyl cis-trans isomerase [Advenella alkanexedens]MDD3758274.1 FKBP-type peptidyl-prolyl cis-trans isomerase [Advenella sp.]NLN67339.1 FKBP-type peptidyl-prolyl cis-trans isomerase [Alcaligenaceae bacterium]
MKKSLILFAVSALLGTGAAMAQAVAVDTLSNGVRVEHTKVGDGISPKSTDTVKVHYRGTLLDGTEFDSSYKRNEPISFPLSRVIPCWTEGLQKMKEGGSAVLFCPSRSAYGERGAGSVIPPNSDLKFEVELLKVN